MSGPCIPEALAAVAGECPHRRAIAGTGWEPTFAELCAAGDGLAARLAGRGAKGQVAILMRHDAPLVAAILGVLRAGATAAVLNSGDPAERLARIREGCAADTVLVDEQHVAQAQEAGFGEEATELVSGCPEPGRSDAPMPKAGDPALIIHTSGSTGRPKGVVQTHGNMVHNARRQFRGLGLTADDRLSLLASPSGGQGAAAIWTALLHGATLCPFPVVERGVTGLADWIERERVSVLGLSASLFRHFVRTLGDRRLMAPRLVRLASEPALRPDLDAFRRHFRDDCVLANAYSCSEAGNVAIWTLGEGAECDGERLPAGRPSEGVEVVLLESGEVAVRGAHLSPGYWGDPALTALRFEGEGPQRMFRTGDTGRFLPDGSLEITGRMDRQVKVRGSQVELDEVEAVLASQREVADAAVAVTWTADGSAQLTAQVVPAPGETPSAHRLRAAARRVLPPQAVPTGFAFPDSLPRTAAGEVDRGRLAEMPAARPRLDSGEAPRTTAEELMAAVWCDAFELEGVARDHDFFDLGGDSLTAAVIAAGVQETFGVDLDLGAFPKAPTVGAMTAMVEAAAVGGRPPIERLPEDERLPLSFAQERTFRDSQTPESSAAYTVSIAVRIRGELDVGALRTAIDRLVERHQMLRTGFRLREEVPEQVIHPRRRVDLPITDVSQTADPEAEACLLLRASARRPFDLASGPLLRLSLARLGEREHQLQRVSHHIVSDAWSWHVFFDELAVLYEAARDGAPPPLPSSTPLRYADHAAWERRCLAPGSKRERCEVEWWHRQLDPPPERLLLPFERRRPDEGAPVSDGLRWWGLDPAVSRGLAGVGRRARATFFMVRLAAFSALLSLETGQRDLVLGTYVTTRRTPEAQAMFGFFSNLTTLRLRLVGDPVFSAWLAEVRESVVATSAHSEVPYERLREVLSSGGTELPEPQGIFGVSDQLPPQSFAGLELEPLPRVFEVMPWRFSLVVDRHYETNRSLASFDARIHDPAAVRGFLDRIQALLAAVAVNPDLPLSELAGTRHRPRPQRRFARLTRLVKT